MAPRILIDSNVFVQAYLNEAGASRKVVNASGAGLVGVVTTQRLLDEVEGVFRKLFGRSEGATVRTAILLFPRLQIIDPLAWGRAMHQIEPHIRDATDAPHFAAARAAHAAAFVTYNRRSVLPGMFDVVPIATPELIIEAIMGRRPWPASEVLKADWDRWANSSRRAPRREGNGR